MHKRVEDKQKTKQNMAHQGIDEFMFVEQICVVPLFHILLHDRNVEHVSQWGHPVLVLLICMIDQWK
jgi:hypothetical protein